MITSLQVGSGKAQGIYREPHWVNCDLVRHRPRGHFAVADGCALPFPAGTFERIHAIHVLEHVERGGKEEGVNYYKGHLAFLREIARVLAPGGSAFIEVPDFVEGMRLLVRAADAGDDEEARIRTVGAFGKGRHEGDRHDWGFSHNYLEGLLRHAGLACERSLTMLSRHYAQEPVLLFRAWPCA